MYDISMTGQILIVEDDRFFRELYAEILRGAGCTVTTASSGEEALERLIEKTYGLVITDLVMPGISGVELLARVKSQDPSIDVILVTAHADLESALLSLKHGARDFLLKPIASEELLHVVRLCMEQRHLLDENVELRNMVGLLQTSQALSSCLDLAGVCHLSIEAIAREVGVGRGLGLIRQDDEFTTQEKKNIDNATAATLCKVLAPTFHKRSALKGDPLRITLPSGHDELERADLSEAIFFPLTVHASCRGILVLLNDAGKALPSHLNQRNIHFLQEHCARALGNALSFAETRDMLYIDELSGLFNYRYLKLALEREVKRADRYSTQLSVVFLDLDDFKRVNDSFGHQVGSKLLRELGQIVKKSVREVDVVIRYGGDEYTLLLVETGPETTLQVTERIRCMIEQHRFLAEEGYHIQVTASLGFASYPEDTTGLDELLSMADKAMYNSKAAGKNRVYRIVSP